MTAKILSGNIFAQQIKDEVAVGVDAFRHRHGKSPTLALVRVGEDPASAVYVASKVKTSAELGIVSEHVHLADSTTQAELLTIIDDLNSLDSVDGILVQLPLPTHIDEHLILERVAAEKDVDGFHPTNVGRLWQGADSLTPCTPAGVIEILKRASISIAGANVVVIGRSNIVGKPMAGLLLKEGATVTVCHSRTRDLAAVASKADILVAAVGRAALINRDHIKEGAVVIDVGINNLSDEQSVRTMFEGEELERRLGAIHSKGFTLVGDVNPKDAKAKAGFFTPVPGGVGLLTVAMLMKNTLTAAERRRSANSK